MNSAVVFFLLATCIAATMAGEPGYISILHNGGYMAYFTVSYKENGVTKNIDSETYGLGATKSVQIPEGATNVMVTAKAYVFIGTTSDIFVKTFPGPVKKCYKIWGFTLSPNYAEIDC